MKLSVKRAAAALAAATMIAAAIPTATVSADNAGARSGSKSHGVQMIYTNIYSKETGKVVASNGKGKNFNKIGKEHTALVKVDLGGAYAGVDVTLYFGKTGSAGKAAEATLDDNGCVIFVVECGKNYALSIEGEADPDYQEAEAEAAEDEASEEEASEEEASEEEGSEETSEEAAAE